MLDKIKNKIFALTPIINDDADFIPLLSDEDEKILNEEKLPETLPILPLRNTVLFPGVVIPITVGREKSIELIKDAYKGNKLIGVTAQKDANIENPSIDDINKIGTVALIVRMLQMPEGNTTIIIQGKRRFELLKLIKTSPYNIGQIKLLKDIIPQDNDKEFEAIVGSLKDISLQIIQKSPNIPNEASFAIKNIESRSFLINFISNNCNVDVSEKQKLLEITDLKERSIKALEHLTKEYQMIELKHQIQSKVKTDLDKQQKEFLLHQQLKQIQEELGGKTSETEIEELKQKAKGKKWSKEIEEKFEKELGKIQRMNPTMPDYAVQLNYLETLVEMPWNEFTEDKFDLKNAQEILDRDHYGLEKVKERIIEYLAVLKLKGDMKSPILYLCGPPGTGKTSLGKSIAESLGRKYIRISLGGIHDEAEIRGHRRTYIGAMPGQIIKNIKRANSSNPVFILDEIDKIGKDFRGDPSSALLEVLDPEQNSTFHDNYLEVDYDLSKVMFIATGNTTSTIQPALVDRMEVIEINGYLLEEKIEIALRHLIPKQLEYHGLKPGQLIFSKKVITKIIEDYTRESGVRTLDKNIAKIIRHTAKFIAGNEKYNPNLTDEDIKKILGPEQIIKDKYHKDLPAGVSIGLAWTPTGGEILYVEVSLSKGKGDKLNLTGNLGDVMKESAIIALEYIKAKSNKFNIHQKTFEEYNVHLHVPEGAIPKDGPSAGIAMLTALCSAFIKQKVKSRLAMTGEITLRGKVLPVGGIKEKILAAKRADIKEIIVSEENRKDIEDIKPIYIKGLKFHYVKNMEEVIEKALDITPN